MNQIAFYIVAQGILYNVEPYKINEKTRANGEFSHRENLKQEVIIWKIYWR